MVTGKSRQFPAVTVAVVLFLLCIYPGQFWATKFFPAVAGLVQINPSLIFLDIPIQLQVTINLILVGGIFFFIYPLVVLLYPSRPGLPSWRQAVQRVRNVFAGFITLLCCMLAGGLIYYLVQEQLPENVRNGINSLGINADLHFPYLGLGTIHLRGSLILLVCFIIGITICIRKIRKEPGKQKTARLTREQRMTPYQRMMQEKRMVQKAGLKQQTHKAEKSWQPVYPDEMTMRPEKNVRPHLCYHQPVNSLTPVAVNFMPLV